MRKLMICSCFILACYSSAHAQDNVPNSGFETWVVHAPFWEDPAFWESTDYFTSNFGATNVRKDSSSHSGVLAAHLATIGHNNQQLVGAMCTGSITYPNNCVGGFPVNSRYATLQGYYKYIPGVGDSCLMFAMLTKWNGANGKRDTVAVATFLGDSALSYTMFSAPFNYSLTYIPDSAQVIIATTKNTFAPPAGSILLVDDIVFTHTVGIGEITSVPVKIFPNPANESLELQIPPALQGGEVEVFDFLGRRIGSYYVAASQELISTRQFPEGIFFYEIHTEKQLAAFGKFVVKH